jgi:ABC-type metal ion transport system substrate-binding protein
MIWLPRRRTSTNPCNARISQTSRPERTRSLPNADLNLRYENFAAHASLNFVARSAFKEQLKSFSQILASRLHSLALAGDVQFWTQGDETIVFALN